MRHHDDDPQKQAKGLLSEWGGPYWAMKHGHGGAETDQERLGTRIDGGGGHSDPTMRHCAAREKWMELDAAVELLPAHWYWILFAQYVEGLSDRKAADQAGRDRRSWAAERDAAEMLFLGRYKERRRMRQGTSRSGGHEAEAQTVAVKG